MIHSKRNVIEYIYVSKECNCVIHPRDTVRLHEIETSISEASKRVPIFVGLFWHLFVNIWQKKETYPQIQNSKMVPIQPVPISRSRTVLFWCLFKLESVFKLDFWKRNLRLIRKIVKGRVPLVGLDPGLGVGPSTGGQVSLEVTYALTYFTVTQCMRIGKWGARHVGGTDDVATYASLVILYIPSLRHDRPLLNIWRFLALSFERASAHRLINFCSFELSLNFDLISRSFFHKSDHQLNFCDKEISNRQTASELMTRRCNSTKILSNRFLLILDILLCLFLFLLLLRLL